MWRKATYCRSASIAALVVGSLLAVSQAANADPVEIVSQIIFPPGNAPLLPTPTPDLGSVTGNFIQDVTGSIPGVRLSPYVNNTDGLQTTGPYSVLGAGNGAGPNGSATYTVNAPEVELLWGSPDPHNLAQFFSPNGTFLGSFTGANLSGGTNTDLVAFSDPDGTIGSIVLSNNTSAAFEFDGPNPVPLPPAIYLFGSVLGGALWLSRRKRSAVSSLGPA